MLVHEGHRHHEESAGPAKIACAELEGGHAHDSSHERERQPRRQGPDHRHPQRRTGRRHPGARIQRRRRDPLRGRLRRRRRGPRPRLRPDGGRAGRRHGRASTSRPRSKASSRSSWRAAESRSRSCGSTRDLPAVRARAGRPAGPADPGLAVRLGGVDRPDRLLLRALGRLAQAPLRGGALAPPRGGALPRAARAGRRRSSAASIGVFLLGVAVYAGLRGTEAPDRNFALTFLFVTCWLGFPLFCAPARRRLPALQPLAGGRARPPGGLPGDRRPAPRAPRLPARGWAAGRPRSGCSRSSGWRSSTAPAAASPSASTRTTAAVAALVYSAYTLAMMALFGIEEWCERGEVFSVYFGMFSQLGCFGVEDGRLGRRRPLSAATHWATRAGLGRGGDRLDRHHQLRRRPGGRLQGRRSKAPSNGSSTPASASLRRCGSPTRSSCCSASPASPSSTCSASGGCGPCAGAPLADANCASASPTR